jgi:hypothetical protein
MDEKLTSLLHLYQPGAFLGGSPQHANNTYLDDESSFFSRDGMSGTSDPASSQSNSSRSPLKSSRYVVFCFQFFFSFYFFFLDFCESQILVCLFYVFIHVFLFIHLFFILMCAVPSLQGQTTLAAVTSSHKSQTAAFQVKVVTKMEL